MVYFDNVSFSFEPIDGDGTQLREDIVVLLTDQFSDICYFCFVMQLTYCFEMESLLFKQILFQNIQIRFDVKNFLNVFFFVWPWTFIYLHNILNFVSK